MDFVGFSSGWHVGGKARKPWSPPKIHVKPKVNKQHPSSIPAQLGLVGTLKPCFGNTGPKGGIKIAEINLTLPLWEVINEFIEIYLAARPRITDNPQAV